MTTPLHAACYADLRSWLRRKRRAILVTAGTLGAGCLLYYGLTRYSTSKTSPPRVWDEHLDPNSPAIPQEADEEEEQEQPQDHLQEHFQGIQVLADRETLPPLLARFKEALFKLIDISEITRQLLAGKEGPQALSQAGKLQLWQKVKILSFTRAVSATWGIGLSHLFIRAQLCMLGRRMFITTASQHTLPLATQKHFMALADFFLEQGFKLLAADAEQAVNQVLGDVSLKSLYSLDELRSLFLRIRAEFDSQRQQQEHHDWSRYVLPDPESSSSYNEEDDDLANELRQVISSPEFSATLSSVLDTLLELTIRELAPQYEQGGESSLPLAKLVPSVSSRGTLLERGEVQSIVEAISELPQVKSLCLLVYGSPGV